MRLAAAEDEAETFGRGVVEAGDPDPGLLLGLGEFLLGGDVLSPVLFLEDEELHGLALRGDGEVGRRPVAAMGRGAKPVCPAALECPAFSVAMISAWISLRARPWTDLVRPSGWGSFCMARTTLCGRASREGTGTGSRGARRQAGMLTSLISYPPRHQPP